MTDQNTQPNNEIVQEENSVTINTDSGSTTIKGDNNTFNIVVFAGDCWNVYGPQIIQIFLSGVILYFTGMLTAQLMHVTYNVQMLISNAQLVYLNQSRELYDLSLKYASGIIEVNDSSFLVNMDLFHRINEQSLDANQITPDKKVNLLSANPQTVPLENIQTTLKRYSDILPPSPQKALNRLCVLTVINNVASVKIPELAQPIGIPELGSIKQEGDWCLMYQGNPAENYVYLVNHKTQQTYIFKNSNQIIVWFMYKDDKRELYASMTQGSISLGNKTFMLTKTPNAGMQAFARVRQVDDTLNLSI
jgi:hypothetical protein